VFVKYFQKSLTIYIRCHCYMFRPHMGHHQATLIIWKDHCIVQLSLVSLGTSLLLLLFVNLLRRLFSSYSFSGRFSVPFYCVVHFSCVSCAVCFLYCCMYSLPRENVYRAVAEQQYARIHVQTHSPMTEICGVRR
jgi:predicted neutral ceramidase superfamily lipid hydrolase